MNRMLMSLLPLVAVACAGAQAPAPLNTVTETSRVARFVAGPGDRPQGALLRNGTFVTFSPGLAQRLPASLSKNASLQVVGEEFSYQGSKTIQARSVTIAGVSYNDEGPMPGNPNFGPSGPGGEPKAVLPPPPLPRVPPPPPPGATTPPPPPPPAGAPPAGAPGAALAPPPPSDRATPPPPPPAPANNPNPTPESPAATPPAAGPSGL